MDSTILSKRLIYITGKGGVGKTTLSIGLAAAAAASGRKTLFCQLGTRETAVPLLRGHTLAGEEVRLGRDLWATSIDPQAALHEWLSKQLGSTIFRVLAQSQAFQFFVSAAPGAKELIAVAKMWELAQEDRWDTENDPYDLVVVDAPASGHGVAMLEAPATYAELAGGGPIRKRALRVDGALRNPDEIAYVAVTLPAELPVNETIELDHALVTAIGRPLDAVIVNGLLPKRFTSVEVAALERAFEKDGDEALERALSENARADQQRAQLKRLRKAIGAPVIKLPFIFTSIEEMDDYLELGENLALQLSATISE